MTKPRVLFVCVENSNRSQMAEGFARMLGQDVIDAYSAGSRPSGKVNPKAVAAMEEVGYDLSTHTSKSLDDIPEGDFAAVITMGCGDSCPHIPAKIKEDWQLPDPRELPKDEFFKIRDAIEKQVQDLLKRI